MQVFRHRRRWYAEKYIAFEQICTNGNSLLALPWSKIKAMVVYLGVLSGVGIGAEKGLGMEMLEYLPPWLYWIKGFVYAYIKVFIVLLLLSPLIEIVKDFSLGLFDRKVLKFWQMKQEWIKRKGIDSWEKEKMKMIREIHAEQCPESKISHKGYVEEEKLNEKDKHHEK